MGDCLGGQRGPRQLGDIQGSLPLNSNGLFWYAGGVTEDQHGWTKISCLSLNIEHKYTENGSGEGYQEETQTHFLNLQAWYWENQNSAGVEASDEHEE